MTAETAVAVGLRERSLKGKMYEQPVLHLLLVTQVIGKRVLKAVMS